MSTILQIIFHAVHTANQAHPGFESDQPHLIYGDSDSEAALFQSIYGTEHHEPDSGVLHSPHAAKPSYGSPTTLGDPPAQLGDNLVPPGASSPGNTPAYTSFLRGLLTQIRDDTDSEADDPLIPHGQSPNGAKSESEPTSYADDLEAAHPGHVFQHAEETGASDDTSDCYSVSTMMPTVVVKPVATMATPS